MLTRARTRHWCWELLRGECVRAGVPDSSRESHLLGRNYRLRSINSLECVCECVSGLSSVLSHVLDLRWRHRILHSSAGRGEDLNVLLLFECSDASRAPHKLCSIQLMGPLADDSHLFLCSSLSASSLPAAIKLLIYSKQRHAKPRPLLRPLARSMLVEIWANINRISK